MSMSIFGYQVYYFIPVIQCFIQFAFFFPYAEVAIENNSSSGLQCLVTVSLS